MRALLAALVCLFLSTGACGSVGDESVGEVRLQLTAPPGTTITRVSWEVRSSSGAVITAGSIEEPGGQSPGFVASLPPGTGTTVTMTVSTSAGATCTGTSAPFDVVGGQPVVVDIALMCRS